MSGARCAALALWCALASAACRERERSVALPPAEPAHQHRALEGGELASLSLYQLEGAWTSAGGETLELSALRGSPVLLLLFYGSCDSACPVLVHDLERVDSLLDPGARERVRFALVTFDPERDTPERLAAYAHERKLAAPRWTFLHGSPEQVRELAAAVGVRYRPAGQGQFSHTMRILLLDREGVAVEHWDGLERPVEPIAARASALAAAQ